MRFYALVGAREGRELFVCRPQVPTGSLMMGADQVAVQAIAAALDRPSVYMGGPSASSYRKARAVVDMLDNYGYAIMKVKPSLTEAALHQDAP